MATKNTVAPAATKKSRPAKPAKIAATTARTRIAKFGSSARQTADDLRRAGSEVLGNARGAAHSALGRAGRLGREVYLAGLGAIASADERGRTLFGDLVRQGEKVAARDMTKPLREAAEPLREAGKRLTSLGGQVESSVERTVQGSLERVGVPSRREIQQLVARIEALSAKVDSLSV